MQFSYWIFQFHNISMSRFNISKCLFSLACIRYNLIVVFEKICNINRFELAPNPSIFSIIIDIVGKFVLKNQSHNLFRNKIVLKAIKYGRECLYSLRLGWRLPNSLALASLLILHLLLFYQLFCGAEKDEKEQKGIPINQNVEHKQ